MVIALFALSLVMIVGGIAAVVQGFPYVRLESGLAMVIGGATAASAGAVLLGIAAAVTELKKLAGALGRSGGFVADERSGFASVASAPALGTPSFEDAPSVASAPAMAAAGLAGVGLPATHDLVGSRGHGPAIDPLSGSSVEPEPPLPDLLPPAVPDPVSPLAPGEPISPDADLFASPDDRSSHGLRAAADEAPEAPEAPALPDPAQEELALRPSLEEPPSSAPEVEPPAPPAPTDAASPAEEEPKSDESQVVGTYSSGANTYVMFANGTIQADTPRGQFTFQSLDELKEFVDSGGEANTRGAA